jgi:hypothetical protein
VKDNERVVNPVLRHDPPEATPAAPCQPGGSPESFRPARRWRRTKGLPWKQLRWGLTTAIQATNLAVALQQHDALATGVTRAIAEMGEAIMQVVSHLIT